MATPVWLMLVYFLVPLVLVCAAGVLLYLCCSKHYRLNWFERSVLEEHKSKSEEFESDSEKLPFNPPASYPKTHDSVYQFGVGHKYSMLVQDMETSSGCSRSSRGSLPVSYMSSGSDTKSDPFWVPSTSGDKRRAQSLIPTISHPIENEESTSSYGAMSVGISGVMSSASSEVSNQVASGSPHHLHSHTYNSGGSPCKTPTSSTSLQEMTISIPIEKLTETVSMVQVPSAAQRQRRRASMQDALDHTKINASLYERTTTDRQQSISSIQEENQGTINFSLDYNREQALLCVRVIQAQNLVPPDFTSGMADPYCRLALLPNSKVKLQSKVQKRTLNPEFEEEFIFEVLPADLEKRTLEILLFHFDQFSQDECIGQVKLPLENLDLSEKVNLWKGISHYEKTKSESDSLGDLMVSLGYLSSAERLTVVVLRARNVRQVDDGKNTANPFVKVSLVYGGKRLKKKKTSTKRNTTNPTWNEALVFSLAKDFLPNIHVEFIVYNDNLIGNNEMLGRMILGPDSTGDEFSHWNDMVNAKSAVARWHHLHQP